ncbi:hypothetical protein WR25_02882 [Diploscapter pachys]|uniref:Uncharacterized protein n=1 Tax=Diploscapter pachys TaxID=2018661 RepID=A0A2A2K8T1_9BILA|nr:hypothetical protein WR25_02882 [Diploscapter pachys]
MRLQQAEQGPLEGEDEIRRLVRVVPQLGTAGREPFQEPAGFVPVAADNVIATVCLQDIDQQLQEIAGFLRQGLLLDITGSAIGLKRRYPLHQQLRMIVLDCFQCAAVQ